jgi:hypothetical protein
VVGELLKNDGHHPVVFRMRANPKPDDFATIHLAQSTVSEPHSGGVNVVMIVNLLELKSGMRGIASK